MPPELPGLDAIEAAHRAIAGVARHTPLVRLDANGPEIHLKLENLQPIGSFKIRGALNAIAQLAPAALARGVSTASAGNMAQGVAWGARERGIPCTVLAPDTAPDTKLRAIERLGARLVTTSFDAWWNAFETHAIPGVEATFIHAFDDLHVMAGNATIGLEILEDLPDVAAVVVPWGGGGLACGIAAALRARGSGAKIYACEVATAAPLAASLAAGRPVVVPFERSFVDGIGSRTVFPDMLTRAQALLDGSLVVPLDAVADAVRLLAGRARVVAEGAGACALAAALRGVAGSGPVVCIVSGGNIDAARLAEILGAAP